MNKNNLYKEVKEIVSQELEGVTIKDTSIFVEATLEAIQKALVSGEKILLVGFGSFEVVERAERMGRNPKDGSEIMIAASKAVKFKPAKALKEAVNA